MPDSLRFGIPSLDELIGVRQTAGKPQPDDFGYWLVENEASSVCIIGPDGTGKSLLSLHLAAEYGRQVGNAPIKIIYASTDLSFPRANKMWKTFWLDRPTLRSGCMPFVDTHLKPFYLPQEASEAELELHLLEPTHKPEEFARFLTRPTPHQIAFLDLASATGGDDWHLLNTILGSLEFPKDHEHRHMLVIDAIEGLETLVGGRDALGEEQERRARIAHVIRAAARKCHLVFVVEEPKDGSRLPEVFVADMVVRLRTTTDRDYARRTVELEKVRGQPHVRGQHDFRIRQAPGTTGPQVNPDEPAAGVIQADGKLDFMSYMLIFPSLHHLSRRLAPAEEAPEQPSLTAAGGEAVAAGGEAVAAGGEAVAAGGEAVAAGGAAVAAGAAAALEAKRQDEAWRYASFGIFQLDAMLAHPRRLNEHGPGEAGADQRGLPYGTVTALIGNEGTYKSRLARAFLSQCFRTRHDGKAASGTSTFASTQEATLKGQGVAVLLTTADTHRAKLAPLLRHHLISGKRELQEEGLTKRLIVRRLDAHHLPAPVLMQIVITLVKHAKDELYAHLGEANRGKFDWRIRFVIDDWSDMLRNHPEAARDPLLVPQLITLLRRERVTALILATHATTPEELKGQLVDQTQLVPADNYLYTWPVTFYGERRVAITALPSLSPRSENVMRELRRGHVADLPSNRLCSPAPPDRPVEKGDENYRVNADQREVVDSEGLVVDPHFELYDRLDEGRPQPIGLQVRLFAEHNSMSPFNDYVKEVDELFQQVFGHGTATARIEPLYGMAYDRLREQSYLQSESRLEHTVVLQVDEFWAESWSELYRQERYLMARTVDRDRRRIAAEDPFGLFQSTMVAAKSTEPVKRHQFFELIGNNLERCMEKFPVEKVPYAWDFGFLLCNRRAWERAAKQFDHRTRNPWRSSTDATVENTPADPRRQTVGDIWHRLWKISRPDETGIITLKHDEAPSPPTAHFVVPTRPVRGNDPPVRTPDSEFDKETSPAKERVVDAVTWREFLGACKTVAHHSRYEFPPFDVDLLATESFSCVILEVWFSEWKQSSDRKIFSGFHERPDSYVSVDLEELKSRQNDPLEPSNDKVSPRPRREQSVALSLRDRLVKDTVAGRSFRAALYRTVLLIDEVLHPDQLPQENLALRPRAGLPKAAACRHWYPTASAAMADANSRRDWVAVGLPGHFSVRGDWFLGIARGSRSPRLGERAIDILSSRRANVVRLQTGLGLPVRDMFPTPKEAAMEQPECPPDRRETRTALIYTTGDGQEEQIRYSDLRKLGAYDEKDGLGRQRDFQWLWRSNIKNYDLHARIWQKWLCLLFTNWRSWPRPSQVWDGFDEYDKWVANGCTIEPTGELLEPKVTDDQKPEDRQPLRWHKFNEMCDILVHALDRATPARNTECRSETK